MQNLQKLVISPMVDLLNTRNFYSKKTKPGKNTGSYYKYKLVLNVLPVHRVSDDKWHGWHGFVPCAILLFLYW